MAGAHNVSYAGGLASSLGYQFADNAASNGELTVTPKSLNVSGATAANKVYDRLTTASLSGGTLAGVLGLDSVTLSSLSGAFDTKDVGTGKTVTVSGVSLAGADAGNYTVGAASGSTTANITAKTLTIAGLAASNKEYDLSLIHISEPTRPY